MSRRDFKEKKAGELLQSKKFQAKALAKKGYSIALISHLLKSSRRTITLYLIEK